MGFVLDCSAAISWCFEDESDEWSDRLLDALVEDTAIVPDLWLSEITNVLVHCERRGRITDAQSTAFLHRLSSLPIQPRKLPKAEYFSDVIHLARKQGLTSYDAVYLHLAMREGLPLATRDAALRAAAQRTGVRLL